MCVSCKTQEEGGGFFFFFVQSSTPPLCWTTVASVYEVHIKANFKRKVAFTPPPPYLSLSLNIDQTVLHPPLVIDLSKCVDK